MTERVNLTGEIGVSILRLAVQRQLGWIIRNLRETDVGIDATIEQLVDGDPKAKYISVQLKTGFGNVYITANGNFTFYFEETHYRYWLSSSIPVIIVLCDPETDTLYWNLITERNIRRTPKGYSMEINKASTITKDSLVQFEEIINVYQCNSVILPQLNDMSIDEQMDYCSSLLSECSESLNLINAEIVKYDDEINRGKRVSQDFMDKNKERGWTFEDGKKNIRKVCRSRVLAMNICTTRINREYPIVLDTHIESIRLFDELSMRLSNNPKLEPVLNFTRNALLAEIAEINSTIRTIEKVSSIFSDHDNNGTVELKRSQSRFSMVISDYRANLEVLSKLIDNSINILL